MKQRIWSIFAMLCFAVVGLVATPAPSAATTVTSTITLRGTIAQSLNVASDSSVQVSSCTSGTSTDPSEIYIDASGVTRNVLRGPGNSDGAGCLSHAGIGAEDGTLYGYTAASDGSSSRLVAWKNNRQIWTVDTTSPANCQPWGGTVKAMIPSSLSQGPDGNLYMVLTGNLGTPSCSDRLFGVNPSTGTMVLDTAIGTPPANGGRLRNSTSIAWTYASYIAVVNRLGALQEYGYDGTALLGTAVSLAPTQYFSIAQLAANDQGTIFALGSDDGFQSAKLVYYKANGTENSISVANLGGMDIYQLQPTADGNIIGIPYSSSSPRLDHFNLSDSTVATTPIAPQTSGYSSSALLDYVVDASGNALLRWSQWSGNDKAMSVDLYDAASSTTNTIFLRQKKIADLSNYPDFSDLSDATLKNAIGGGNAYLAMCQDSESNCFTPGNGANTTLYKVSVGNFSTPIAKGYKRNSYVSHKLNYVAMGDSFSSGEGNNPFVVGTSITGTNECHRSPDAYPMLLEKDASLNLNMTAFVACSGATTSNITASGQWGESKQLDAVSSSTNVVTLTIGGNDAGFADAMNTCTFLNQPPPSWLTGQDAYDRYMCGQALEHSASIVNGSTLIDGQTFKSRIASTVSAILDKVGANAKVYVIGYPNLFPEFQNLQTPCIWGASLGAGNTSTREVDENEVGLVRQTASSMNTTLSEVVSEVNDSRVEFIDARPSFVNHEICGNDTQYLFHINYDVHEGSYHPNTGGQDAYYGAIKSLLSLN